MKVKIEINERDLRELIRKFLQNQLGTEVRVDLDKISIEVKSKQNYKSEWEVAAFRAIYENTI